MTTQQILSVFEKHLTYLTNVSLDVILIDSKLLLGNKAELILKEYYEKKDFKVFEFTKNKLVFISLFLQDNPRLDQKITNLLFSGEGKPDLILFNKNNKEDYIFVEGKNWSDSLKLTQLLWYLKNPEERVSIVILRPKYNLVTDK